MERFKDWLRFLLGLSMTAATVTAMWYAPLWCTPFLFLTNTLACCRVIDPELSRE